MDRRDFVKNGCRTAVFLGLGTLSASLGYRNIQGKNDENHSGDNYVWQIDPNKCVGCNKCATHCVLNTSAVKCFHNQQICGYCEICTGFFDETPIKLNEGAENQLCPTNAIIRQKVEGNYFEYSIDSERCVGCGKCVKGCTDKGNGSLFLQIDQSLCKQCNQCALALQCPAQAISRVPVVQPYLIKRNRSL